jgi:hypothetical protein
MERRAPTPPPLTATLRTVIIIILTLRAGLGPVIMEPTLSPRLCARPGTSLPNFLPEVWGIRLAVGVRARPPPSARRQYQSRLRPGTPTRNPPAGLRKTRPAPGARQVNPVPGTGFPRPPYRRPLPLTAPRTGSAQTGAGTSCRSCGRLAWGPPHPRCSWPRRCGCGSTSTHTRRGDASWLPLPHTSGAGSQGITSGRTSRRRSSRAER